MNEPKKRGRPSRAELEARMTIRQDLTPEAMSGIGPEGFDRAPYYSGNESEFARRQAQAYANRMWAGQSTDLPRAVRVDRIKTALEAQGLSMEGVQL